MLGLFKKKKTPEQLVQTLLDALVELDEKQGAEEEIKEEIAKRLHQIIKILYGEAEKEINPQKCHELAKAVEQGDLLKLLVYQLERLPFEARKHVAQIFNNLMKRAEEEDYRNLSVYVSQNAGLLDTLVHGYDKPEIALNCGSILRECIRHQNITEKLLHSDNLWLFFDTYVHLKSFDVASDAFATFKELLTKHKELAASFLDANFDRVFDSYNNMLLQSDNYVTRRQSLKLLGEILLDRNNFVIMMRYISMKKNLRMMMNMLRDKSANIQFEAFHVFKVFVANPKKPPDVAAILFNNKEKLIAYLENFHNEKEDEQFREEKALLIKTLSILEPAAPVAPVAQPQPGNPPNPTS